MSTGATLWLNPFSRVNPSTTAAVWGGGGGAFAIQSRSGFDFPDSAVLMKT